MQLKLLQINTSVNTGSAGRITEDIGKTAKAAGYESFIAYGRKSKGSCSKLIRIGNKIDLIFHLLISRLFDRHGLGSKRATQSFVRQIEKIKPSVIHIHNIHGYYINYKILFNYLNKLTIPVIWTLHDCWPMTGHCTFFDAVNCDKWLLKCHLCPNKKGYPKSLLFDNSKNNHAGKKALFSSCRNLIIVSPSMWLAGIVQSSFLGNKKIITIHNGVDIQIFQPATSREVLQKYAIPDNKFIILGVANHWDKRKGLADFVRLSECIDNTFMIVLVGLNKFQQKDLPANIAGISRTENIQELAQLYSISDVFVNPTRVDNFPTVNIEALACGTPVITYRTGGSPEVISDDTGFVIEKGDIAGLKKAIETVSQSGKDYYSENCRRRAVELFNKEDRYNDYIALYNDEKHY